MVYLNRNCITAFFKMAESRHNFTVIWKIRNVSFSYRTSILTPVFLVQPLASTKWRLIFSSNEIICKDSVSCYLMRDSDEGPYHLELNYELSFLNDEVSVLHSEIFIKKVHAKGSVNWKSVYREKKNVLFLVKKKLFLPNDTLLIRCRMWSSRESIPHSGLCFAETQIETQCVSFVGTVENFASTKIGSKNLIKSPPAKTFFSSLTLFVGFDGKLIVEIKPANKFTGKHKCEIFIRDVFGNKVKSGQGEFYNKKLQCISLTPPKTRLIQNKGYYLLKDVLTLQCDIIFSIGKRKHKINEPEYGFHFENFQKMVLKSNLKDNFSAITYCSTKERYSEGLTTLMDDLVSLFNERILYDTSLKTATETFPAHTIVLSARSPVFKSMFTTDMKEKINKYINIDDLDADTVRRMLSFMYSDTLDGLEYESAKNLYFAADKYNIVSLRHMCSNFFMQNIQEHCCDILLLSDKHQDKDLKIAVEDYIAKNFEVVLFSNEWKNVEKEHSQLAVDVLRSLYLKKRK